MTFTGPAGYAGSACHGAGDILGKEEASTLMRADNHCLTYPLAFYVL